MNNLCAFMPGPEPVIFGDYKYVSINDLCEMDLPERGHLLAPWLPEQSVSMVFAERGIGKTFFALNVAYAVATGGAYLGWKADKPRRVLYLDGEMAASDMQTRARSIVNNQAEDIYPNLFILTPDVQRGGVPDLSVELHQRQVSEAAKNSDLVIIDNIATLVRSGNENETGGWRAVQDWALTLKANGKSVLFVHHSGKNGKQRGASSREDVMNTVVQLKRPSDYSADQGARFEVHFSKARGFRGDDARPIEAQLLIDDDGNQTWSHKIVGTRHQKIQELQAEGLNQSQIAAELKVDKSTISRDLKVLKQQETLEDTV